MKSLLEALSLGWIGNLIGLLGIFLGIFLYLRSRKRAKIAYQYDDISFIGSHDSAFPSEVEIYFNGIKVNQVSSTRIVIWNCGEKTIDGSDIVSADQLRISCQEESQILKYSILKFTRAVTSWHTNISPSYSNELNLSFDFLDPEDGVLIEIITSALKGDIEVLGTIKGIPEGVAYLGRASCFHSNLKGIFRRNHYFEKIINVIMLFVGLTTVALGLSKPILYAHFPKIFEPKFTSLEGSNTIAWPLVLGGFLYALIPLLTFWLRRRRFPNVLEMESLPRQSFIRTMIKKILKDDSTVTKTP